MYKEVFSCKYGRVVYGTDCKRCNRNKQCLAKGEKRKNEKVSVVSTA